MLGRALLSALIPALVSMALGAGCGDDGGGPDAGPIDASPDGMVDGGSLVAPPEIPWLADGVPPIMLTPCPAGWREVTDGHVTECDPYPAGGPDTCAAGEAHFPGEPGCRPIGDACPGGDYATTLPATGPILYVKAGAAPGGDGSLASPFGLLSDVGWSSLAAGTTVALAAGDYEGTLPLRVGVGVVGACVERTRLTGLAVPVPAVVTVSNTGDSAVLRNVAITNPPQFGIQVASGRALTLSGVLIDGATTFGVLLSDTRTTLTATDLVVRGTRSDRAGTGRGLQIQDGARLEVTRLLAIDNRDSGVSTVGGGAFASLESSVIRATLTDGSRRSAGIRVTDGATLETSGVLVAENQDIGVVIYHAGTEVRLTDSIVRETQPGLDGAGGRGISVLEGAQLELTRSVVASNRGSAIFGFHAGTTITLTDAVLRNTLPNMNDGFSGRAISVDEGVTVSATRVLAADNRDMGLFAAGEGAMMTLTDVAIRDTEVRQSDGAHGRCLNVQDGAVVEATRLLVSGCHTTGVASVTPGSRATLTDVVAENVLHASPGAVHANSIHAEGGGRIEGTRIRVEGTAELGIVAVLDAVVELSHVSVLRVGESACLGGECSPTAFGYGVAAVGAVLDLRSFEVREAEFCGSMVSEFPPSAGPTALDLATGIVGSSTIGACVQVDGYDLDRLSTDVVYVDNDTNLDSTMLPVPTPIEPTGF